MSYITNILPKLSLQQGGVSDPGASGTSGHLFAILASMLKDPRLEPGTLKITNDEMNAYSITLANCQDVIKGYAEQWDLSGDSFDGKVEELYWSTVLIYGVGGWNAKGLNADFFQ